MYTRHIISIFNPIWIVLFLFKRRLTSFKFFFRILKNHFFNLVQIILIVIRVQKFWCFPCSTYFLFLVSRISSTALLTMAFSPICLLFFVLGTGLIPRSLEGLLLAYLVPKYPRNLYYSEECPGPWTRLVLDFPDRLSSCRFLGFPELSPLSWRVHDKADSPLLCLLWPARLDFSRVGFL